MPKMSKKRRRLSAENNYYLRSKTKSNKNDKNAIFIENNINININIKNSQNCEQIDLNVSNNSSTTHKLTKMPIKYYNLRRRGIATNEDSNPFANKTNVDINDLPDDCLLLIFEKLDTIKDKCYVQSVCKRFQYLMNRLLKAQKIFSVNSTFGTDFKTQQILTKKMCKSVIKKCPNLQMFKMPGFYAKDSKDSNPCTNERIGDNEMMSLADYCRDLRELDICGCGNVSEIGINHVIKHCPSLEKLSISFCTRVTGTSFKMLTKSFKSLSLNGNEFTPSLEQSLKSLNRGEGKYLTELNVCMYNTLDNQERILHLICDSFPNIDTIRYSIFARTVCKFGAFGRLKNLTHLAFDSNSVNLNDEEFIKIMKGCGQLKTLFIRYDVMKDQTTITDYSMKKLPHFCPNLEKLHFHSKNDSIHNITDSSIINFVQLKHLESFSFKSFVNIGDSVIYMIKSCPKLNYLFLLNCEKVTNATIDALIIAAKAQPFKKIKFNLYGNSLKRKKRKLPLNLIDCSDS